MLFPNHPAYAEIRAGMGYQPGAFALGYSAPYHGMGEVSQAQMQAAWDQGLDGNTIDALSAAGATDADIQALMAGDTDVATLMEKYAGLKSGEGTTVTTTPPATSAGEVPKGSQLLYTAAWTAGLGNLSVSPDTAVSSLGAGLAPHGMTILSSEPTSDGPVHYGIQVSVLDSAGHAFKNDAQSILDALMHQIVGNNLTGSSLSITATPGQTPTTIQSVPASNPLAWLENNAVYIGAAVAALVLLNNFTGRRR